jgi:hypothetical protein
MINTSTPPVSRRSDSYSLKVPVEPEPRTDAEEMLRASRVKIDRSLDTLRRVARLLAETSKKS